MRSCSKLAAVSATKPNLAAFLFQRASHIVISPTFSPAIYRSLEQAEGTATPKPNTDVIVNSWRTIGSDLPGLPNLAKVTFWFDHDEPFRWAHVNEKALLSSLADSICGKDIQFHVSLPYVHPGYEDAAKHFTGGVHAPLILSRRTRRWYDRGESCSDVDIRARQKDFADALEMFQVLAEFLGNVLSRSDLEKDERDYWKAGTDLKDIAAETRALSEENAAVGYNI